MGECECKVGRDRLVAMSGIIMYGLASMVRVHAGTSGVDGGAF